MADEFSPERAAYLAEATRGPEFDLRHVQSYPQSVNARRRVLKTHPGLHRPALDLEDFIANPTPPTAVKRSTMGGGLQDVLGNDTLGDCGEAMSIHGTEALHLDAGTPVPPFTVDDAISWYSTVGGYVPGDPSTDNGTDNNVLVQDWQRTGIPCAANGSRHKIIGSLFVNYRNPTITKVGIWEFGVVFRALGLPITAQNQTNWSVVRGAGPNGEVGSWGYHDVPYLSYDPTNVLCDSWGADVLATWQFDEEYAVGGFVVMTQEMLSLKGVGPSGLNWTQLNAAFRAL